MSTRPAPDAWLRRRIEPPVRSSPTGGRRPALQTGGAGPVVLETGAAGRRAAQIDRVPPLAWLALQAIALWPHWQWAAARMVDGSDDPLGLAALVVLALATARLAPTLRHAPSHGGLAVSMILTLAATAASIVAMPLPAACLAVLALVAGVIAFAPAGTPRLPLAGLGLLALPVVSSLQFYAGYPLRVATAELSTWLLRAGGVAAERSGTAMLVEGRLVIVDAPCSGVQMVWMAYFCACTIACWRGLDDRRFLRRLAGVGGVVLIGNVLRNGTLVLLEARTEQVPGWLHEGIGLVALALVCAVVVTLVQGGRDARR